MERGILTTAGPIGPEVVAAPISALHRSTREASASCDGQEAIVDTIATGDLVVRHIGDVEAGPNDRGDDDASSDPRHASQPRRESGG